MPDWGNSLDKQCAELTEENKKLKQELKREKFRNERLRWLLDDAISLILDTEIDKD